MVYCLIQNRNSLQQFSDRYCLISADHLNLPYLNKMDLMKWPIFSLLEPEFACKIKMACVYGMYSILLLFNIPKGSFQDGGIGSEIRDSFTVMHINTDTCLFLLVFPLAMLLAIILVRVMLLQLILNQ